MRSERALETITYGLGNKVVKHIQKTTKEPACIWKALQSKYASQEAMVKAELLTELHSMKIERGRNIEQFSVDMDIMYKRIEDAGCVFDEFVKVTQLLAAVQDDPRLMITVQAIRATTTDATSWDSVTARLNQEGKATLKKNRKGHS